MNRPDPYEGNFVQALDIEKPTTLTISKVHEPYTKKSSDGRLIERAILEFEGARKMFILNITNQRVIWALHGKDRKKWPGKQITIARRYGEFFGVKNAMAVRVIPPNGTPLPVGVKKRLGTEQPT